MNVRKTWRYRQSRRRVPTVKNRRRYFGRQHKREQKSIEAYGDRK
jgi:hypothetical protein